MELPPRSLAPRLLLPVVVGFALVLPFMVLEALNTGGFDRGFPTAIFSFLWILQTAFMLILTSVVRSLRGANSILANPAVLLLVVAGLAFIAWAWGSLVADQLPCFLGVPNCD